MFELGMQEGAVGGWREGLIIRENIDYRKALRRQVKGPGHRKLERGADNGQGRDFFLSQRHMI